MFLYLIFNYLQAFFDFFDLKMTTVILQPKTAEL